MEGFAQGILSVLLIPHVLHINIIQELIDLGESDCLIKTKQSDAYSDDCVGTLWFLLSALTVKVVQVKQARVNSGSNYDSLKVAKCLVI